MYALSVSAYITVWEVSEGWQVGHGSRSRNGSGVVGGPYAQVCAACYVGGKWPTGIDRRRRRPRSAGRRCAARRGPVGGVVALGGRLRRAAVSSRSGRVARPVGPPGAT